MTIRERLLLLGWIVTTLGFLSFDLFYRQRSEQSPHYVNMLKQANKAWADKCGHNKRQ